MHSVDVEGRRVKIDRIATGCMDFGAGVLCGVLSRPELAHLDKQQVEDAIDNIRAAARFVDRYHRETARAKRTSRLRKRKS